MFDIASVDIFVNTNLLFILAPPILCREVRNSRITEAIDTIINAVKVFERKASQRHKEVFC